MNKETVVYYCKKMNDPHIGRCNDCDLDCEGEVYIECSFTDIIDDVMKEDV